MIYKQSPISHPKFSGILVWLALKLTTWHLHLQSIIFTNFEHKRRDLTVHDQKYPWKTLVNFCHFGLFQGRAKAKLLYIFFFLSFRGENSCAPCARFGFFFSFLVQLAHLHIWTFDICRGWWNFENLMESNSRGKHLDNSGSKLFIFKIWR